MTSRDDESQDPPWLRPGPAPSLVIELPGQGWLVLRAATGEMWFTPADGDSLDLLGEELLAEAAEVVWAVAGDGRSLVIAERRADRVHCFEAVPRRLHRVQTVERLAQAEELALSAAGDLFVVLTENGVIALEQSGRERWRISQTTWGWHLVADTASELCFTDTNGNLVTVDRVTGREASY